MRKKYKLWPKSAEIIIINHSKTLTDNELAQKIRETTGFICDGETVKKKRQSLRQNKQRGPGLWHKKNAEKALDKPEGVCHNQGVGATSKNVASP